MERLSLNKNERRFFFFFQSMQNGETYVHFKPGNLSQSCRHLSTSPWAAGLICARFIGKSKHRKSMVHNESFRFIRERAPKLLYRPTTTTFCLAPVRIQHVLHLVSRFWLKNSPCVLVFSPSDPERSRLEVYVYPFKGLFISKIWSVETLRTFLQMISFVFNRFEKGPAWAENQNNKRKYLPNKAVWKV